MSRKQLGTCVLSFFIKCIYQRATAGFVCLTAALQRELITALRVLVLALIVPLSLVGCYTSPGADSGAGPGNAAQEVMLTLTGTPAATAQEATPYAFTPVVNYNGGNALAFSITNLPAWATFDAATGTLSGTPGNSHVGTTSGIAIRVSDGTLQAALATFDLSVTPKTPAANTLTITGTPAAAVYEATPYLFTPVVSYSGSNSLTFSITNLPTWATFNTVTGTLSGTPANSHVGITSDIVIRVTDGTLQTALAAFNLTVKSTTARLSWNAPTMRSDGSALPLSELAGYRIYTGTTPDALVPLIDINDPGTTTHTITKLPAAQHYYAVSAYNISGVESERSAVVSKTISALTAP